MTEKGYIHLYTGDGKGKTTAALGLALRAAGAHKKVFIGQFIKGMFYSELNSLKRLSDFIEIRQFGRDCFIEKEPDPEDMKRAMAGLKEMEKVLAEKKYDLVIFDEITIALHYNLITLPELLNVIRKRPENSEIVLTGRAAPPELYELADLVTEMKEVKHYYQQGILAREGFDK